MLHRDTWPNRLGFDICEGETILAEVLDDPLFPYVQIRTEARSNRYGRYLRLDREFSLLGRPVRLELPPLSAILTLVEDLGEEIE